MLPVPAVEMTYYFKQGVLKRMAKGICKNLPVDYE